MSVYSFGNGKFGQLGLGNFEDSLQPSVIEGLKGKRIVSVSCGEHHSLAISELGNLYCWGRGKEGQLGIGEKVNVNTPMLVQALRHERITKAVCGFYHTLVLTSSGRLYTFGKLYKQNTNDGGRQYFGLAVHMPGLKTQQMLDRSLQK